MQSDPDNTATQELRYRELFRQAPVSLQILAPGGRTLRVNKAWEALWQIHAGSELHAFILDEYNVLTDSQLVASGVAGYLRRALAGEAVEIPAIRYDVGRLEGGAAHARWVTARAHPIKDDNGAVLEVMLMHEDITDRVTAESALRVREERFRSLVMATSQIVWTSAADGRVLEDSPSWRAFTGQSYEEWKEYGWLDALHPDDRETTARLWAHCVATRGVFETEYRLRRADGAWRWTAVKGVPIADEDGAVREWIGANTDIHDMVMSQAERMRLLASLQEQDRRKDEFLAMLAYELRNPLAPISAAADMLKFGRAGEDRVARASEVIGRQVRHMTALVDDLLDVSRVTRGLIQLECARVEVDAVVASAVEQARPLFEAREQVLDIEPAAGDPTVTGDAKRLVQVLVNLLNNAAKYTPRGGRIVLSSACENGRVQIAVRDNGIGIDARLLPQVFDLFTQAERTPDRAQGGLGIGLALVRIIVVLHGGTVSAHSDGPGQGSTFTISLALSPETS
ncbi:Alkaline phosphatase synthesis sensor protein PhoR [Massilia sp. Bi118]|uniref:sensor histidine kinase n=1 Tax=Massilia sp. Bi118 TaxID=2822346 RepID=UPI001E085D93|nr:ATP-binding protein [Massilia sp. Bi118]CAH0315307.1 Alkaline phosphatase synthesis sensor protein PhoR [Massilia sp. Bi118]